jgi:hypothetical protein
MKFLIYLTGLRKIEKRQIYGLISEIGKKEAEIVITGAEAFLKECENRLR